MPIINAFDVGRPVTTAEDRMNKQLLGGGIPPATKTISNGVIALGTDRGGVYKIDTEGGAATDDAHTVTGLLINEVVVFILANVAHHVRFLHNNSGGNLRMNPPEFTLNSLSDWIMFWNVNGTLVAERGRLSIPDT